MVESALRKGGYATFQTGVPFYQPWEITEALQELARFFPRSGLYPHRGADLYRRLHGAVLGHQGRQAAGQHHEDQEAALKAYKKAKLKTDYYNPAVHAAAFALPNWIAKLVP